MLLRHNLLVHKCIYGTAPFQSLTRCHTRIRSRSRTREKPLLPPLDETPATIKALLHGINAASKSFMTNIRRYNSALAFVSMGAQIVQPTGRGPYVFRIHGQIYHRSGTLHPATGVQPSYGQLYMLEGNEAVQQRMDHAENHPCQPETMQALQEAILEVSPYARAYKHMAQIEQEESARDGGNEGRASTVQMVMKRGPDQWRFNEPSHDEVAAVFVGSDGAPPIDRDITVYPRDHPMQKLSFMSSNCDPMTYPLLRPHDIPPAAVRTRRLRVG